MIVIHEFGHYLAGKALGFKITEFSIGFGPIVFSRTLKNGEKFSLRAFPLGGFCAFYDEDGTIKETKKFKSFVEHAPYKRIVVLFAGAAFNFLSAFVFCFIFIGVVGFSVPTVNHLSIDPMTQQPYAVQLKEGDRVIAVNGKELSVLYSWSDAMSMDSSPNASFELTVLRNIDNEIQSLIVSVKRQSIYDQNTKTSHNGIGFNAGSQQIKVGFGQAALDTVPLTLKFGSMILGSFGDLVSGKVPLSQLSGPISTVTGIAESASLNAQVLLLMLPLIAANLAIFNLLPIPALDGSRIVFATIEWIRRKPIKREIETTIHFVGFVVLIGGVLLLELFRVFS